ncbi:DsbC family protein [Xanthomonas euvesicatoria pv. euvesicatoria]|uniref:DsbC family protein n=2 Tax=Lysobacterales TaxID=135614 RepID=UPI001E5330AE|nr:DsbC family protein [Xanthomonas euvesicatoria]MCC8799193.1 DsbC family protein [Xanthomonas euvesicatoria pv. euvesicatoria]
MMNRYSLYALLAMALTACSDKAAEHASPGIEMAQAAISKIAPHATVTGVAPAAVPGLLQVTVDGKQIIYLSDSGKHLLAGQIIELDTNDNITERASSALHKKMLSEIPAERKIVYAAEDPKHAVTVFTDVDCGYCRVLHEHIADYNKAGISIEYVLYPRSGVQSPTYATSVSIWCAEDRKQALTAATGGAEVPPAQCANPIAADYALGQQLGVTATPAIFAEDGRQVGGLLPPAQLLAVLEGRAKRGPTKP